MHVTRHTRNDMYNANRSKEFCEWFKRTNPVVQDMLMEHKEDNEKMEAQDGYTYGEKSNHNIEKSSSKLLDKVSKS